MPDPEPISFDLLHEPWIPCERPDGSRVLVGIEAALLEAHTFVAMHDESPLVTATLHRLLLAILQRVFLPRTVDDWVALWEAPKFDANRIRVYLTQWRTRFDLFDRERPFLQVAHLREILHREKGKEPEPTDAWRLSPETSRYSSATSLFEGLPTEHDIDPAHAARALLGFLGFTPGGRIQNESESWRSGPLRGGAVVLVRAETLQRTLLCNLIWRSTRDPLDLPPWERETSTRRVVRAPFGPIDLLVWPSRRVEFLVRSGDDAKLSVREVITAAGERIDADTPDPMFACIVRDPKNPPFPMRVEADRAVWRDSGALFDAAPSPGVFRRPAACNQIADLVREGVVSARTRFCVEVYGLASNQAAIDLWRADRMPLPPSILSGGQRFSSLRDALALAEDLARNIDFEVLNTLAENALAPSARKADNADIRKLKIALGAIPTYWASLGQAFPEWLDGLGTCQDIDSELLRWREMLRAEARKVVTAAALHLGTGARALQAAAKADRALARVLVKVLGDGPSPPAPTKPLTKLSAEGIPS